LVDTVTGDVDRDDKQPAARQVSGHEEDLFRPPGLHDPCPGEPQEEVPKRCRVQHAGVAYVLVCLSLGQRECTIRPLRRTGPTPDFLPDEHLLLIRRSHTRGEEVIDMTKTKRDQDIKLPQGHATDAMRVHYSTAHDDEVQAGIATVIDLAGVREARDDEHAAASGSGTSPPTHHLSRDGTHEGRRTTAQA
jgi:hypothetical protein